MSLPANVPARTANGTTVTTGIPTMPRSAVAVLHIGYWGLYLLLLAMLAIGSRINIPVPRFLFETDGGLYLIVPNVVAFYVEYFFLTPRLFPQRKFGLLAVLSLLTALASTFIVGIIFTSSNGTSPLTRQRFPQFAAVHSWLSVLALIHMTLAMVIRGFISWYEDIAVKERLAKKSSEVEGALLRAKLDPHFLFNTLNNIDVLITRDAAAASSYVNQLSDILRFVLYEARADRVPLESELAYFDKYITLQRIRLSNPKTVSYSVSGNVHGWSIAPMLLIPFVENAFKHAAGERDDNAIMIAVTVDHSALTFVCSNSYQRTPVARVAQNRTSSPTTVTSGLGKELMQQRLELLYPHRHTLAVSDANNRYSVRLDLTLDKAL